MQRIPLRLGPLQADGYNVLRSGVRWLHDEGYVCRAGEVVAYCNVGLQGTGKRPPGGRLFAGEEHDVQVAIVTRAGGRLARSADSSPGGWLDQLHYFEQWTPDFVIGHIEQPADERVAAPDAHGETTRLLMLAGRRATTVAEVHSGLLGGWYDRRRAWWGDGGEPFGSLLCLGVCDQAGIVQGESRRFFELFDAAHGAAHVAYFPNDTLVHCAAVVSEQFGRTSEAAREIADDFSRSLAAKKAEPQDWMFASAYMASLLRSPVAERHDVLTRTGLGKTDAPGAILMSLHAEGNFVLRHRRLGYAFQCHAHRIFVAGPVIQAWLRAEFEQVRRTPDDVRRDYCALIDAVRARSDTEFLVLNMISTATSENVHYYGGFEQPLGKTLGSVRTREMNLMLHDLARERNVAIVDADAIAADLGTLRHTPDGMHGSALLEGEIRSELLRLLRDRGVRGFAGR